MSFKFFDKLSQDFSELLNDEKEYNVVIEVDKEENKKSFTSLSCLTLSFNLLHKELENIIKNENHVKTIIKPNISTQIFEIILNCKHYIENIETKFIYELMIVANELEFEELLENLGSLKRFCNDIITEHPNLIFESEDFTLLQEAALISILENDNQQLEEIKIWDYVIEWGIAQNPKNLEEWSKENFKTLKTTLQQFKSLVLPARIISNPKLPQRVNELISTIINEAHVAEISSWIDRKSTIYTLTNVPYKLQLILRGSEDGFQPQTFWDICDRHAGTIVIAKVAGTDEILGGYNPLAWDNSTEGIYMETNDSFIFSLKNGNI
ncbi:hypothetical protein Glove_229g81 [Diversispora epigaea]|uniref:TLDc domain-containing protein n=1 Tax=Diversispora epigaea TaxID=1348612 RepID=A0A397IL53_9GLOM|nr:hypothetical protein Glove_229g81 [Diversispora epigaea]